MYICVCKGVTDRQIQQAAARGLSRIPELARECGIGTQCGKCTPCLKTLLKALVPGTASCPSFASGDSI